MELSRDERIMEKYNEIEAEVLQIGWSGILEMYHPDVNVNHIRAFEIFQTYKSIYERLQMKAALAALPIELPVAKKQSWVKTVIQKIRNILGI